MVHHQRGSAAERSGRTAGFLMLGLLVTAFIAVCTVEIIRQAWGVDETGPAPACREGLVGLLQAVNSARSSAEKETDEERAIQAFRSALYPQWNHSAQVQASCRSQPDLSRAFQDLEQLRYAEERAVRYEARDLTARRRQMASVTKSLGLAAPTEAFDQTTPKHD